ncbi:hypothetical protein B0H14DRAFT_2734941 [Mycena olivaceomarginata]|nr:hypothetical protein B0H14DRAFT_2734941 [Mycena olivaceomarginata]
MSSAQESVISTPELLEHTLSLLPMRDLLVAAPLVSRTWHTITLSPTIQRALFFNPDLSAIVPVQNPLLAEIFPPFFASECEENRFWGTAYSIKEMPWADAPDAFKRANASWRRMLVTQPPTQTMVIVHRSSGMGGSSERRAVVNDLSLRMGLLYDIMLPLVHNASFRLRWNNGEGDLTISLRTSVSCTPRRRPRILDERFESEAKEQVHIDFGEWVSIGWR